VFAKRESSNAAGLNGDQTNNSLVGSGAVYIFTKTEEEWSQQAYIKSLHPGVNEFFGYGLAMSFSGDTLAVGSQEYWDIVKGFRKAVQIFSRNGDIWSQQAYLQPTRYQSRAGLSLAISQDGNILAVGDSSDHHIEASSGAVYIFARDANSWSQQAFIKASEPSFYGEFGYTIYLRGDGNKLIVGARGESSDAVGVNGDQYNHMAVGSGAAYLF